MSLRRTATPPQLAGLSRACNACSTKQEGNERRRHSARQVCERARSPRAHPLGDHCMKFKHMLGLLSAAAMSLALTGGALAQQTVKIGAIFPFSGNAASAGSHAKAAIEVAMDIINDDHPELGDFPLAKGAGLPGLGGAKVEVVFADNQGSPATGQNQALRLITEEKVAAITGAYQSGVTLTTSAIAEKYGIPFVNGES